MANPNADPTRARLAKKAKARPGNIQDAAGAVWDALETAREILSSTDTNERLKACHATFQGAQAYAKLFEVGELEARLSALERGGPIKVKPESSGGLEFN